MFFVFSLVCVGLTAPDAKREHGLTVVKSPNASQLLPLPSVNRGRDSGGGRRLANSDDMTLALVYNTTSIHDTRFNMDFDFDIYGILSDRTVVSTGDQPGYRIVLKVDGLTSNTGVASNEIPSIITHGETGTWREIQVETTHHVLSSYAILVAFRLTNVGSSRKTGVGMQMWADAEVDDSQDVALDANQHDKTLTISRLDHGNGDHRFTFIGGSYPLVRDISHYWFGPETARFKDCGWNSTSGWTTSQYNSRCRGSGAISFGFTWFDMTFAAGESKILSLVARSGDFVSAAPSAADVVIVAPSGVTSQLGYYKIEWRAIASDFDVLPINISLVIDDDFFNMRRCCVISENNSTFVTDPIWNTLAFGCHSFSFYSIDGDGCVSQPFSQSVCHDPMNLTFVYDGVSSYQNKDYDFAIFGLIDNAQITCSGAHPGFRVAMQVDGEKSPGANETSSFVVHGVTNTFSDVQIETQLHSLGDCAILVAFRLTNVGSATKTQVGVQVWADGQVDGSDSVAFDYGQRAKTFTLRRASVGAGERDAHFTFIGGNYSLVRDLSTWWYGKWSNHDKDGWSDSHKQEGD